MTRMQRGIDRRLQLLEALAAFIDENSYSPTERELAGMVGMSRSGARYQIGILRRQGRITGGPGHRTMRLER